MTLPAPPPGALVRHTTHYKDGTAVTVEGRVAKVLQAPHVLVPHILIGAESRVGYLKNIDGPVELEVLHAPPAEPPNGTVFSNEADAIIRCDDENDPEGRWETTGSGTYRRWHEVAPTVTGRGWRRYVPDPADDAPELPWETIDDDGDRLQVQALTGMGQIEVAVTSKGIWRGVNITPAVAKAAGLAILRAAREVEKP